MNDFTKYTLEFTAEQIDLIAKSITYTRTQIEDTKYWTDEESIKEYEALIQLSEYIDSFNKIK